MSIVKKDFEQGSILVQLSWDKYAPNYHLDVVDTSGPRTTQLFYGAYYSEASALSAYYRQVKKVKYGDYQ